MFSRILLVLHRNRFLGFALLIGLVSFYTGINSSYAQQDPPLNVPPAIVIDGGPLLPRDLAIPANPFATEPSDLPADSASALLSGPLLHLKGGGFLGGRLVDSASVHELFWQHPAFLSPFVFPLQNISSANFPVPKAAPKANGEFTFDLGGGDFLFGSILSIDESTLEVETQRFGKIRIGLDNVQRIYRWQNGASLVYLGLNGLTGWKASEIPKDAWSEESGQLVTEQDGAAIVGDLGLPDRAIVEFELSWEKKPDFDFALGTNAELSTDKNQAFHFEVWAGQLVVNRETEDEADVNPILALGPEPKPGRVALTAYLDQTAGRIEVYSPTGEKLAEVHVPSKKPKIRPYLSLINKRGDLRLERLRISRWNGKPSQTALQNQSRIHKTDGTIVYGKIKRFDAAAKAFVVDSLKPDAKAAETEQTVVQLEQLESLFLVGGSKNKEPRTLRVLDREGTRLSGQFLKVENNRVFLKVPGIEEALAFDVDSLNSLTPLVSESPTKLPQNGAIGILELDGARTEGQLFDAKIEAGGTCLAWKPVLSSSPATLKLGTSGKLDFREKLDHKDDGKQTNSPQVARPRGFANLFLLKKAIQGNNQSANPSSKPLNLYLRTGDVIPCIITKIDEAGLTFSTALSESTFVGHDKVKAVELGVEPQETSRISKTKRDRLLTLPRMQKDSPPLQLVRSLTGDYLRGRLIALDDKTLQIETRLETKVIPRHRISKIIWLHPDTKETPAEPLANQNSTQVQAVRSDGVRLTFNAELVKDATLIGKSEVLGICRVALKDVDQILIGDTIEKMASQLAYQQWKLQNAQEPKASQPADGTSTDSTLVGMPAPPFELDLLDGGKFKLASHKGKVVILEFWATWCGPCLQTMPQVEQVADEFKDQGIELIAINLQESPKSIKDLLERQKYKIKVALDVDGATTEKYQANAIPQSVIIDREGNVAQLFVGGGPHFDDDLRAALKKVLAAPPKTPPAGETPKAP